MALAWMPITDHFADDVDEDRGNELDEVRGLMVPEEELPNLTDLLSVLLGEPWMRDALCRERPDLSWFPARGEDVRPVQAVCARCLVRDECDAYADSLPGPLQGIWAGVSARQRRTPRGAAA